MLFVVSDPLAFLQYSRVDTNDNPKKRRKYRKLNHFIKENTIIRHIIKFNKYNHIWKGIYYPKNDKIIYKLRKV